MQLSHANRWASCADRQELESLCNANDCRPGGANQHALCISTYCDQYAAPDGRSPSIAPSWIDLSGAVTSMSSTSQGAEASRVVASANPSSRWGDNTCSHTNGDGENTPWWKVELGGNYGVSKVLVLNRGDCCGERLNGFTVKVGDTECATNVQITQGQALEVPCVGTGSSVTISLPRHGILTLCEVKVFGYGTTAAPDGEMRSFCTAAPGSQERNWADSECLATCQGTCPKAHEQAMAVNVGFPRACGPNGRVDGQWNRGDYLLGEETYQDEDGNTREGKAVTFFIEVIPEPCATSNGCGSTSRTSLYSMKALSSSQVRAFRSEHDLHWTTFDAGKYSFQDAVDKCGSHGMNLCSYEEYCSTGTAINPRIGGGNELGDLMNQADLWAPFAGMEHDGDNTWLHLTSAKWPVCSRHELIQGKAYGKPTWGLPKTATSTNPENKLPYVSESFCCSSDCVKCKCDRNVGGWWGNYLDCYADSDSGYHRYGPFTCSEYRKIQTTHR